MTAWLLLAALAAAQRERAPVTDPVLYDAVVLGGSLPAMTAAWELERRGLRVLLLAPQRRLASGSGRECAPEEAAWLGLDPETARRRLVEKLGLPEEQAARGLEERLRASPRARVRVRSALRRLSPGEHLVSVAYAYQGLPHLARARRAVFFGPAATLAVAVETPDLSPAARAAAAARVLPAQPDCRASLGAAAALGERLADAAAGR